MLNKLHEFFTRENITLAIAIFGAIGTLFNWLLNFFHNRRNLKIKIVSIRKHKSDFLMYVLIENRSRLPISISSFSVKIGGAFYPCRLIPKKVRTDVSSGKGISTRTPFYTMQFPVNIGSLGAASGYVFFDSYPQSVQPISIPLIFRVATNRGASFQISLQSLGDLQDVLLPQEATQ